MSGKNPFLGMGFGSPFASFVGSSSASSSPKIVVGAMADDDDGLSSGSVYVYDLDGTNEVKITASDAFQADQFGTSVAIAHNKIVVGSYLDDDNGNSSGSVYLYNLDGTGETKITASDAAARDRFGYSVAIGNNKIAVGAFERDVGTIPDAGSVYIYDLDGNEVGIITASDADDYDRFGNSVAIAHNKIVVGSYLDDENGTNSGSIYVYDLDGTNEVKITASDGANMDLNGYSVAIGSNKIVAGAYSDDDGGSSSGSVYVYDLDGTNEVKITASDAATADYFGVSVAVGHNKIAVGAIGDDDNGDLSGSVYLYNLDGTGETKITASDGATNDRFGSSVAIAHNKIVVGAERSSNVGAVYVYNLDGTGETKITASDGADNDVFGRAVALG